MLENYPDILTAKQLYEILPVGKNKIYSLLTNGKIKSIHEGNKYLIPKQCVIEYLEAIH